MRAHHGEKIVARIACRDAQIALRWSQGIKPLPRGVDEHRGGRIALDDEAAATLGECDLSRGRLALWQACQRPRAIGGSEQKAWLARPAAPDVPIEPLRLGDNFKAAFGIADRLGAPQQKNATFAQGEVEEGDHLLLRLRAEVDEQISA